MRASMPGDAGPEPPVAPSTSPSRRDEPETNDRGTDEPLSDTVEDLSVYGTRDRPDGIPELPPPPTDISPPTEIPLPEIPASVMSDQPLLPTDAWTSESSHRIRSWLMLAGAATLGIFVAVGVFALVAMQWSRNKQVAVAESPGAQTVASEGSETPADQATSGQGGPGAPDATAAKPRQPADSPPADDPAHGESSAEPPTRPSTPSKPVSPESANGGPIAPGATAVEANSPASPDPAAPEIATGGTALPESAPPADEHPPGLVATSPLDEAPPDLNPADEITGAVDTSMEKTLKSFEELLDGTPPGDGSASAEVARRTPAELGGEPIGPPRPEPRAIDLAARLEDTIPEIQFENMPLNDFLRFVANLSTIPITLIPDALRWSDVAADTPVSAHQKETTTRRLLEDVVESQGLALRLAGDQLLITLPEAGVHRQRVAVADLAASPPEMTALQNDITRLVAPESWQTAGGLGRIAVDADELVVQQSSAAHRQVIEFLEKLRLARGLSPSTDVGGPKSNLASRTARCRDALQARITLNFFQPTPLDVVIDRLAKSAKCHLLIDWQALTGAGWNADTQVTLTITNTPLVDALNELLTPRGLAHRCVDSGLLQVTTADKLHRNSEFEIYPVPDLIGRGSAADVLAGVREKMGTAWLADERAAIQLDVDKASRSILACLPQPGQVALENAIAELRSE